MEKYAYAQGGKSYITFPTIRGSKTEGVLRASYEYNLGYNVTDKRWFGDCVNSSGWWDMDYDHAEEVAKAFGLDKEVNVG